MQPMKCLKLELEKKYEMCDIGYLHYCPGVIFDMNRKTHRNILNQNNYIKEVLKHFNMEECKSVGTPLDANSKLLRLTYEESRNAQKKMEGVPYKA